MYLKQLILKPIHMYLAQKHAVATIRRLHMHLSKTALLPETITTQLVWHSLLTEAAAIKASLSILIFCCK